MTFPTWLFALAFTIIGPSTFPVSAASVDPVVTRLFMHNNTTTIWSCKSMDVAALVYQSGMTIDADGAYRAYHPDNRLGLDTIENAGRPGNWWALATDNGKRNGRPVIQTKNDPAPGFYVSTTALYDSSITNEKDPRRFVDAASIPYVVLPPEALKYAKLGDFATVINLENGKKASAIVADISGPDLPMGEGSIALAKLLDIDPKPRDGGTHAGIAYVVYPGSGNGKPRSLAAISRTAKTTFEKWGGMAKLGACLR